MLSLSRKQTLWCQMQKTAAAEQIRAKKKVKKELDKNPILWHSFPMSPYSDSSDQLSNLIIMPHDTCAEIGLWIEDSLHELVYRNSSEVQSNRPLTSRPILNLLNWAISATVVRAMILGAEFSRNQHARRVWTLTTAPHPHIPVPCLGLSFFLVARISAFRHCDEAVWENKSISCNTKGENV